MVEHLPSAAALRDAKLTQRFGTLFALLVTTFIVSGFSEYRWARALATVLQLAMIVVAFRTTRRRGTLSAVVVVVFAGVLVSTATVLAHDSQNVLHGVIGFYNAALYLVILIAVFRLVVEQQRVSVETLLGALCVYFLIGLLFASLYLGVDAVTVEPLFGREVPNEDYSYFSFVTLTTVGYGDFVAHTDLGRRIAVIEAMTGQIFLATAVARLVSLYGVELRGRRDQVASTGTDGAADES